MNKILNREKKKRTIVRVEIWNTKTTVIMGKMEKVTREMTEYKIRK